LTLTALLLVAIAHGQEQEWMAPEGFTVDYRTLTWDDFKGKEDKDYSDALAARNLQAMAYVCPAIYFTADSGHITDDNKVHYTFHVKCAFQSRAFVRESTKHEKYSGYVLNHEQDHYDIALLYARKLYQQLTAHDYSADKYNDEIDKLSQTLMDEYNATQRAYDEAVNPEGNDDTAQQHLWDMRIKKCMDRGSTEFFGSPLTAVQAVGNMGQIVTRIPGEPAVQFLTRVRPLYTQFAGKDQRIVETSEWSQTPALLTFYTQHYFLPESEDPLKEHSRTVVWLFTPTVKDTYKRMFVDTFNTDDGVLKPGAIFFANADSDQAKELVIMATVQQNTAAGRGTRYINRVYNNVAPPLPGRLMRMDDANTGIESGFEGTLNGKPSKAKFKTEKDVRDALSKAHGG